MDKLIYIGKPFPTRNVLRRWTPGREAAWSGDFRHVASGIILASGLIIPDDLKTMKAVLRLYLCNKSSRDVDPDGVMGGVAPVVNALKQTPVKVGGRTIPGVRTWGLYHDDAPTWLELHVAQIKACPDDRPGTYMNIEWVSLTTRTTIQSIDTAPVPKLF